MNQKHDRMEVSRNGSLNYTPTTWTIHQSLYIMQLYLMCSWVCVCPPGFFYTLKGLYPIQIHRKPLTNEVSCWVLSHKRIPLILINNLVRRPAKNSPSERGKSGQGSYRVYSHSHTQTHSVSTPWPKHPYIRTICRPDTILLGHFFCLSCK